MIAKTCRRIHNRLINLYRAMNVHLVEIKYKLIHLLHRTCIMFLTSSRKEMGRHPNN
jgi:hypothetical protein